MDALLKEDIQETRESFKIDNLESANWALRKIRAYKEQIQETNDLAEREIERIKGWQKKQNEESENSIQYFEYLLTQFFSEQRQENPKFKLSTPYGTVKSRKQQDKWNYSDEEVIKWAELNNKGEYIRVKKELDKSILKKVVKVLDNKVYDSETGEEIPGIIIEAQEEKIIVEVE